MLCIHSWILIPLPQARPKYIGFNPFFDEVDRILFWIFAILGCTYLALQAAIAIKLVFHILDKLYISKNFVAINLIWFGAIKNMVNNWVKERGNIKPFNAEAFKLL